MKPLNMDIGSDYKGFDNEDERKIPNTFKQSDAKLPIDPDEAQMWIDQLYRSLQENDFKTAYEMLECISSELEIEDSADPARQISIQNLYISSDLFNLFLNGPVFFQQKIRLVHIGYFLISDILHKPSEHLIPLVTVNSMISISQYIFSEGLCTKDANREYSSSWKDEIEMLQYSALKALTACFSLPTHPATFDFLTNFCSKLYSYIFPILKESSPIEEAPSYVIQKAFVKLLTEMTYNYLPFFFVDQNFRIAGTICVLFGNISKSENQKTIIQKIVPYLQKFSSIFDILIPRQFIIPEAFNIHLEENQTLDYFLTIPYDENEDISQYNFFIPPLPPNILLLRLQNFNLDDPISQKVFEDLSKNVNLLDNDKHEHLRYNENIVAYYWLTRMRFPELYGDYIEKLNQQFVKLQEERHKSADELFEEIYEIVRKNLQTQILKKNPTFSLIENLQPFQFLLFKEISNEPTKLEWALIKSGINRMKSYKYSISRPNIYSSFLQDFVNKEKFQEISEENHLNGLLLIREILHFQNRVFFDYILSNDIISSFLEDLNYLFLSEEINDNNENSLGYLAKKRKRIRPSIVLALLNLLLDMIRIPYFAEYFHESLQIPEKIIHVVPEWN